MICLIEEKARVRTLSRTKVEWFYDSLGLTIQGLVIPLFPWLLVPWLRAQAPALAGTLDVPALVQFLLSFVVVDYLYYWNHRWLHGKNYWALHRLHHSSRMLDIFATSRNSFITSFLMVYFWVQIVAMFILKDSAPFMLGFALTFALDLYRHSGLGNPFFLGAVFSRVLILPQHLVLHHSLAGRNKNFGANFQIGRAHV
jgi:sterol desaturase/sphingolipid hydroxylase (fatty acid hydroxylase superfamily)